MDQKQINCISFRDLARIKHKPTQQVGMVYLREWIYCISYHLLSLSLSLSLNKQINPKHYFILQTLELRWNFVTSAYIICLYYWGLGGRMVKASDSWQEGRGFDYRVGHQGMQVGTACINPCLSPPRSVHIQLGKIICMSQDGVWATTVKQ